MVINTEVKIILKSRPRLSLISLKTLTAEDEEQLKVRIRSSVDLINFNMTN